MSLPEIVLWHELRGNKLGVKFRRQHPIGPYIVDFYCTSARLVVEVDGEAHNRNDAPDYDRRRDLFPIENGHDVLRVAATDVLNNLAGVTVAISARAVPPLRRCAPPPRAGEE